FARQPHRERRSDRGDCRAQLRAATPTQRSVVAAARQRGREPHRRDELHGRGMLTEAVDAMAGWPLVGYLRTSRAAYATVNATHIVGMSLLVGAIVSADLRTAGLWKADRWREGLETCVPVAAFGLLLAAISGVMLFSVRG